MHLPVFILTLFFAAKFTSGNISITFPEGSEEPDAVIVESGHKEPKNFSRNEITHHVANVGLKTLRELLSGNSNVVLCPFSIYSCLGILGLGAEGDTKEEIYRVLGPRNENHSIKELIGARDKISQASAVFLDDRFTPKPDFVNYAMTEYEASIINVNVSDGEQTKNYINNWVKEQTNGTIEELLQGRLEPDTRMIIVSALLFKGKWQHPFPQAATAWGEFHVSENSSVSVQLMHLLATVPLMRNSYFDGISLPYFDNHGMTMHLILPKIHGIPALKKLLSHLNANSLKKLTNEWIKEEIFVVLPKIKLSAKYSLTNPLKAQGIESMFNPEKANFTNFIEGGSGLFVSKVYQSIHFEIDEEGTVASAATASILTKSTKFTFRANRPFIFVITDESGLILFIGSILHPE